MKKKICISVLLGFIIFLCGILFISSKQIEKFYVYEFDVNTDHLILKDFLVISGAKSTYIPNSFYIENITDKNIRDVSISIKYGKKPILSFVFQFDQLNEVVPVGDLFIPDLNISSDGNLVAEINYMIDGKNYEFFESIELSKFLKHKS